MELPFPSKGCGHIRAGKEQRPFAGAEAAATVTHTDLSGRLEVPDSATQVLPAALLPEPRHTPGPRGKSLGHDSHHMVDALWVLVK